VWKVLRETEGERFMTENKVRLFQAELQELKNTLYAVHFIFSLRMFFMRSDIFSQQRRLQIEK